MKLLIEELIKIKKRRYTEDCVRIEFTSLCVRGCDFSLSVFL